VVPGGEGVGGAKKKDKEYELSSADEFWLKHKGSPFPQVGTSTHLSVLLFPPPRPIYLQAKYEQESYIEQNVIR
jgi:hypothetical protein